MLDPAASGGTKPVLRERELRKRNREVSVDGSTRRRERSDVAKPVLGRVRWPMARPAPLARSEVM